MNHSTAIAMTTWLLSFSMLIQAAEYISLLRKKQFYLIWDFNNISSDLYAGLALQRSWIDFLFSNKTFKWIVYAHLFAALGLILFQPLIFLIILFFTHLLICIRFRGTFNGGSDMMTFVLLTGMIISYSTHNPKIQSLGLLYIAVHAVFSYFKAGYVKIKNKDWRSGKALPLFLEESLYPDIKRLALWLKHYPTATLILCWLVMAFELSSLTLPFLSNAFIFYFSIAVLFHFTIYLTFGLNRFFWLWMTAWPAIFYSAFLI